MMMLASESRRTVFHSLCRKTVLAYPVSGHRP